MEVRLTCTIRAAFSSSTVGGGPCHFLPPIARSTILRRCNPLCGGARLWAFLGVPVVLNEVIETDAPGIFCYCFSPVQVREC